MGGEGGDLSERSSELAAKNSWLQARDLNQNL